MLKYWHYRQIIEYRGLQPLKPGLLPMRGGTLLFLRFLRLWLAPTCILLVPLAARLHQLFMHVLYHLPFRDLRSFYLPRDSLLYDTNIQLCLQLSQSIDCD